MERDTRGRQRPRYRARRGRRPTVAVEAWPYRRLPRSRGRVGVLVDEKTTPARRALRLAALVFVQYALVASDIRFVASANYVGIAVVNVCIAINTWYLTRGIIGARTRLDRLCFVVGGTAGALVAVLLT